MKEKILMLGTEISIFIGLFFSQLYLAMFTIGALIMIDTVTGIWAAYKEGGINKIHSRKLGRVVAKLILYPFAIWSAFLMEFITPEIPFVKVTLGILATVEGKSIFENISKVLGYDLLTRMKKALWKDKIK